jgi:hypothetical protein
MDDEHVLAFVKTIDGAHFDAVGIFALNAALVDDIRHSCVSGRLVAKAVFLPISRANHVRASAIV